MNQKLQDLLTSYVRIPDGLDLRIIARIEKAARRRVFEKVAFGSIASIVFAVALVIIGRETMAETATSGFGQYMSLIWSNSGAIVADWRDFAWTIIESAPITGLALCLGMTGMLVAAVRWTGKAFNGLGRSNGAIGKLAM